MFIPLSNATATVPTLQLGTAQQPVESSGKPSKKFANWFTWYSALISLIADHPSTFMEKMGNDSGKFPYHHGCCHRIHCSHKVKLFNIQLLHVVISPCQYILSDNSHPNFSSFDLLCSKYWSFKKVIKLWPHDNLQSHFSFVLFFSIGHFQALSVLSNSQLFRWVFWMKYLGK